MLLSVARYGLKTRPTEKMHLAVVACGDRLEETVTMLKSALIFSIKPLHVHIFAEDQLHDSFKDRVSTWRSLNTAELTGRESALLEPLFGSLLSGAL